MSRNTISKTGDAFSSTPYNDERHRKGKHGNVRSASWYRKSFDLPGIEKVDANSFISLVNHQIKNLNKDLEGQNKIPKLTKGWFFGYGCGSSALEEVMAAVKLYIPDTAAVPPPPVFPLSLEELTTDPMKINSTTGAQAVKDKNNNLFIKKQSGSKDISRRHLISEYLANKIYKAIGVPTPEVTLYDANTMKAIDPSESRPNQTVVMLSAYLAGTEELKDHLQKDPNGAFFPEVQQLAQQHFIADCLLANWDCAGANNDNIRINPTTKKLWRVDNGGALTFRAQGGQKGHLFSAEVTELDSLRDPNVNGKTSALFLNISKEEVIRQIDDILSKEEVILKIVPQDLKEIMTERLNYLRTYKSTLQKEDLMPLPQNFQINTLIKYTSDRWKTISMLAEAGMSSHQPPKDAIAKRELINNLIEQPHLTDDELTSFLKSNSVRKKDQLFLGHADQLNWLGKMLQDKRKAVFDKI